MKDYILREGQVIAERYEVERYIDAGGMQEVYVALDHAFERRVALKTPKNDSAHKRFDRSAQISARIVHSNLAKTIDYVVDGDRPFLIEEFIQGQNLSKAIRAGFRIVDPHLLAHIMHNLARAIVAAHHAGVFHRDLKPNNIMVSADAALSMIKVTDFGIARMAEVEIEEAVQGGLESISSSQTALGALPYMAPELIDTPKAAGLPADIWALGAIGLSLMLGKAPFGVGYKAVPAILNAAIPDPRSEFGNNPLFAPLEQELWKIFVACLTLKPDERPKARQLLSMCSSLCYSTSLRRFGSIHSIKAGNGRWGKIVAESGEEVFYHEDSVYGGVLKVGARVSFACSPGIPYARAFPVLILR